MTDEQRARLASLRAQAPSPTTSAPSFGPAPRPRGRRERRPGSTAEPDARRRRQRGLDPPGCAGVGPGRPGRSVRCPLCPAACPGGRSDPCAPAQAGALDAFVRTVSRTPCAPAAAARRRSPPRSPTSPTPSTPRTSRPRPGPVSCGPAGPVRARVRPLLNSGPLTNWEGRAGASPQKPADRRLRRRQGRDPVGRRHHRGRLATRPPAGGRRTTSTGSSTTSPTRLPAALVEAVRESWAIKLDAKVRACVVANAVAVPGATEPTLLRAVARGVLALKRRKVGRASFVVVNDEDWFTLFDITNDDQPAFLDLFNIDPRERSSSPTRSPPAPCSPVSSRPRPCAPCPAPRSASTRSTSPTAAIDEAFFGYWAIEEHHTTGIASVQLEAA